MPLSSVRYVVRRRNTREALGKIKYQQKMNQGRGRLQKILSEKSRSGVVGKIGSAKVLTCDSDYITRAGEVLYSYHD